MSGVSTDVQAPVPSEPMTSSNTAMALNDTTPHSIISILERPVLLASGVWSSTDPAVPLTITKAAYTNNGNAPFLEYDFPSAIFTKSTAARDKVGNFRFMRADIEFEIKVNATPFQSGSLLVVYNPYNKYIGKFRNVATRYLSSLSSLPHRILSLEDGNSLKIQVPYANIYDYFDLSDDESQFGTIQVYILSGLVGSVDTEKIGYSCFARFVNPELYTPSPLTVTTQNGVRDNVAAYASTIEDAKTMMQSLKDKFGMNLFAQGEGAAQGSVARISAGIDNVKRAHHALGWLGRIAGGVASALGFSKPTDEVMPISVINLPGRYMANAEGKDYSQTLAMITDNGIDSSSMIPETNDEMSLKYILSQPNIVGRVTTNLTDRVFKANNLLWSWEVSPFLLEQVSVDEGHYNLCLGTLAYTSMLMRYWRGSLKFNLRVIKTQYHSGRFVVVYFPGGVRGNIPDLLTDEITTCYNVICDLKEKSADEGASVEYPIEVPYISNQPWKETLSYTANTVPSPQTLKSSTGVLAVYALTDLVYPETVGDSITFLLSMRAGDDFELAVPTTQLSSGFNRVYTSEIDTFIRTVEGTVVIPHAPYEVGNPVNVTLNGLFAVENGVSMQIYIGKQSGTLSGIYVSNPVRLMLTFGGGNHALVDTRINCTFVNGYCVSAYTYDLFRWNTKANTSNTYQLRVVDVPPPPKITDMEMHAQIGGRSLPEPDQALLVPGGTTASAISMTIGEYVLSLRSLIMRFSRVAEMTGNRDISYSPFSMRNISSDGYRSTPADDQSIAMPESNLSLVSNLFRFYAGGFRLKVFSRNANTMRGGLVFADTNNTTLNNPVITPQIEQSARINNAMELTVPYYGTTRCRVTGGENAFGLPQPKAMLTTVGAINDNASIWEAAADDLSMFFLVGPPVMHIYSNDPVYPPTLF